MPSPSRPQQPRAITAPVSPLCLAAELVDAPMHVAREIAALEAEMSELLAELAVDCHVTPEQLPEFRAWLEVQA